MERQINFDNHPWGENNKVMEFINKRQKSFETFRLFERPKEITKRANLRFKFDSSLNRKVMVLQRRDKRGRDEVAAIDIQRFLRNNERNRWGGGYSEFNEPKPSSIKQKASTTEDNTIELESISRTEESGVAKSLSNFPLFDTKDYDIAERTIH